jgi:pilus assembly protein Flp/PilA
MSLREVKPMRHVVKVAGNERAATAVEYGLILACIVLAMMGALRFMATTTIDLWDDVANKVHSA